MIPASLPAMHTMWSGRWAQPLIWSRSCRCVGVLVVVPYIPARGLGSPWVSLYLCQLLFAEQASTASAANTANSNLVDHCAMCEQLRVCTAAVNALAMCECRNRPISSAGPSDDHMFCPCCCCPQAKPENIVDTFILLMPVASKTQQDLARICELKVRMLHWLAAQTGWSLSVKLLRAVSAHSADVACACESCLCTLHHHS